MSSKTKDLDDKFRQVLTSMDLDTAGGLVEILSRQGKLRNCFRQSAGPIYMILEYLQMVIAPWKDFALDWIARCSTDNEGVYLRTSPNLPAG